MKIKLENSFHFKSRFGFVNFEKLKGIDIQSNEVELTE